MFSTDLLIDSTITKSYKQLNFFHFAIYELYQFDNDISSKLQGTHEEFSVCNKIKVEM